MLRWGKGRKRHMQRFSHVYRVVSEPEKEGSIHMLTLLTNIKRLASLTINFVWKGRVERQKRNQLLM